MSYSLLIAAICYRTPSGWLVATAGDHLGALEVDPYEPGCPATVREPCPDTERCPESPTVRERPITVLS